MDKPEAMEILLVEDNDYDAELTLRALKQNNSSNRIIRFSDGQEALDYLFQPEAINEAKMRAKPKLILLDLKLPGVSGLEVLQAVKSDPRTRLIPVVVLTSSTEEKDIINSYQLGGNSYISKPVEFDNFMETMKHLGLYWLLLNKAP
ncbi:MAG TPA: response regulator [Anaerolineaceae bacterium]